MGMNGPMSDNPSSHHFADLNQEKGSVDPMSYIPGTENIPVSNKHLVPNQKVGDIVLGAQKQSLPTKRKAAVDTLSNNSLPKQSSVPNKRVAQMEPLSALNKRSVQMQSMPSSPGSLNIPIKKFVRNESISSKSGSQRVQTPKNRTAPAEPSPKAQNESFEAVRSKMRETLAAALSVVCQHQEKAPNEEKSTPCEAVNTPLQVHVDSQPANESMINSEQTGKSDGQESQFNYVLPDGDGSFSDSFFVKDELLQGNGLSWAWDMEVAETKEVQNAEKPKLVHIDVGGNGTEQVVSSPQDLALKIETELFKLFGGVNKKYKEKGRSLMFNLKDHNNPELRERVLSGEISPERLCSMTPEELASKELSEWRMAKAEELAQMKVLPDSNVDIRRLVKKTHKGEYQVEVEQDDGVSVEVSVGSTSLALFRPKHKETGAHPSSEADEVKVRENVEGEKSCSENQDLSCSLTIPADGTDFMQEIIVDEFKDEDFLPPIVSLDEFMESLNSEPPFENLPVDAGQVKSLSDKENSETGDEMLASDPASLDPVDTEADRPDQMDVKTTELELNVTTSESPTERKLSPAERQISPADRKISPAESKISPPGSDSMAEHVWEGELQLNFSSLVTVIGLFRSGEKTLTKEWPSSLEIKGRVRLDAFEKFLQELPMSRSRAVMVVHFVLKDISSENDRASLSEVVDSYVVDERLGFSEPTPGVELYFCPPHKRILEMLSRHLSKDQTDILGSTNNNGLVGVVVWRRAHLSSAISPNSSSSHNKHNSKKQNLSSRRPEDKNANVNMNLTSRSPMPFGQPPMNSRPAVPVNDDDDDDDIPPGFGPGAARDEDDLPEFNFSGNLNSPTQKSSAQGSRMTPFHLSSRPVEQMRELIYKYGQTGNGASSRNRGENRGAGLGIRTWNDDEDDDIPEWQPQVPQPSMHIQQPLRPHMVNQQLAMTTPRSPQVQVGPPTMPVQQPINMMQNPARWVQPSDPHGLRPNNGQHYGVQWGKDAPRSRGF